MSVANTVENCVRQLLGNCRKHYSSIASFKEVGLESLELLRLLQLLEDQLQIDLDPTLFFNTAHLRHSAVIYNETRPHSPMI